MSDFNKGDFTQQGVDGHVRATLRLNEKRYVELDLTTNEDARGCTISGNVHDRLNNLDYPIGAAPSGNIEITENGENINVAPYATATVNVAGGGAPYCTITLINKTGAALTDVPLAGSIEYDLTNHCALTDNTLFTVADNESVVFTELYKYDEDLTAALCTINDDISSSTSDYSNIITDLVNITVNVINDEGTYYFIPSPTDSSKNSSYTLNYTRGAL